MTKTQKVTARLDSAIAKANGTGRQRLLGRAEVAQVITEAMRDDYGSTNGGSVARAYSKNGNIALTSVAFAVANGPDYIAVKLSRINALASAVTWAGPDRINNCMAWVAKQTLYTLRDWIILSRAECRLFIRSVTAVTTTISGESQGLLVTLADSLAAGNCQSQSERVAGWFAGRSEVPAKELMTTVAKREPLLITFVHRAIAVAERRAHA